jgi:hypothetical protein
MNPFKIDGIVEGDDFMQASGATSSASIKRGLEALETKVVIWQKDAAWIFTDPYFGLWIANAD